MGKVIDKLIDHLLYLSFVGCLAFLVYLMGYNSGFNEGIEIEKRRQANGGGMLLR